MPKRAARGDNLPRLAVLASPVPYAGVFDSIEPPSRSAGTLANSPAPWPTHRPPRQTSAYPQERRSPQPLPAPTTRA
jgi:hypothetical protein